MRLIAEEPPEGVFFRQPINLEREIETLISNVLEYSIDLVIVDTISEAFQTEREDDNAEANHQMQIIQRLAREGNCVVILVHHIGKGQHSKTVYRARGASARAACADVVLNLTGKSEEIICLEVVKNRWVGGTTKLFLHKAGEDIFEVAEGIEDESAVEKYKAQELITEYLSNHGESLRKDILSWVERQCVTRGTFDRALSDLVQLGKVLKMKRGVYSLPR